MGTDGTRAPLTIALLIDTDRARPKQVLAALSPQLRNGDTVVVLGPRSSAAHPGSWWEVRARRPERAGGVRQPHDCILVLREEVELADGCLDALVAARREHHLSAVAPRAASHDGGHPSTPAGSAPDEDALRRVAEPSLADSCLLVDHATVAAAGGLEALRAPAGIAHLLALCEQGTGAIAAVDAARARRRRTSPTRPDPLVSACLIVRDEAHQLAECLASITAVADEIVVYDTGSEDDTAALAATLGATVVAGYWDDDFARARNDALAHCHGQWILWIDADERLIDTDAAALRTLLSSLAQTIDGLLVPIDNLRGTEAGTVLTHSAVRLFRRAACHWEGRLHEQIVRHDGALVRLAPGGAARLLHRGYLDSVMHERNKTGRNMRSALSELAGGSTLDLPTRLVTLGRSHMLAGRQEEGVVFCRWALERSPGAATRRLALRALGDGYIVLGRYADALAVAAELREPGGSTELATVIAGRAYLGLGDNEAAAAAFASLRPGRDVDGFEYGPELVADKRARALVALGRHGEAADVLLETLRRRGGLDTHLGLLIEALDAAGRGFTEIVDALEGDRLRAFLPPLLQIEPDVSDRVLESWIARLPANLALLATAAEIAPRLEIARQLAWSARLRQAGFAGSCPLVATATAAATPLATRALAGAVAGTAFGDLRGDLAFVAASAALAADERDALHIQLAALSPAHAERLRALPPPPRPPAVPPLARDARSVVVVARQAEELRSVSLAAHARRAGHAVTLLSPATARPAADALAGLDVITRAWREGAAWESDALGALARLYALEPIDAVVLGAGTEPIAERVRALAPYATVLCEADLRATAGGALATRVLAPLAGSPQRIGVLAVADLRGVATAAAEHAAAALVALRSVAPDLPIALCGDDPDGAARAVVNDCLALGTCADPRPWLSSCAAVVLLAGTEHNNGEWLALAAASGTPAFVLGTHEDPAAFAARVHAGEADTLSQHPRAVVSDDPLPGLPARPRRTRPTAAAGARPLVRLTSDVGGLGSLSQVNRELAARLADPARGFAFELGTRQDALAPEVAAELAHVRFAPRSAETPALEIRHQWPPDFAPSTAGCLVCIQPFEFGGLPAEWVGPLRDVVDELWVPSTWVRECAIASGVPTEKVHVVPNGVDVDRYRPTGARYPLRNEKRTRLLFVGGCIPRKGFDALLEVYLSTFTAADDVCLVVKPFGGTDVYAASSLEADLRRAAASDGPAIEIVDDQLGLEEMASLYRACDVLVHPYRGEGFALPVAEAMACGLPVVVTAGGACDDFCDDEVAWMLPARRVPIATGAFTPSPPGVWWLEPDRSALGAALREIVAGTTRCAERGARGAARIATAWTWDHAAARAAGRINALLGIDTTMTASALPGATPTGANR